MKKYLLFLFAFFLLCGPASAVPVLQLDINDGVYILLEYLKPNTTLTMDNCFFGEFNLSIIGKGRSDSIIVDLMNIDWNLSKLTSRIQDERFDNPEIYIKVEPQLRYLIIGNEDEPTRDVDKNNLDYIKTYEMKIIIGV